MVFKLIHYVSGSGDGSELEFFLLPLKVLFERFLHWLILAKLCMVLSCADVISCYFGTKASCNTAIPRILIIVLSTSRKAMGTVLKQTFILENSTTWRSLNSQEPLFMRHYLMLVIWFLLFQAEICEPEIKENFISEAPECNIFEAKYFTQQLLQRQVNILLRAAHNIAVAGYKVCEAAREYLVCLSPGHPCCTNCFRAAQNFQLLHPSSLMGTLAFLGLLCPPPVGCYYSRGWSRVWSGSEPWIH